MNEWSHDVICNNKTVTRGIFLHLFLSLFDTLSTFYDYSHTLLLTLHFSGGLYLFFYSDVLILLHPPPLHQSHYCTFSVWTLMCARARLRPQRSRSERSSSSCGSFCRRRRRLGWPPCSRRTRRRKSWWRGSRTASPAPSSPSLTPSSPSRMRSPPVTLSSSRWGTFIIHSSLWTQPTVHTVSNTLPSDFRVMPT